MPTIKDVARASGVCPATVSQVLNNGRRPVNRLTRERVLAVAHSLDYRPNAIARGLVRKRMDTIGVVFLHDTTAEAPAANSFLISVLSGILAVSTLRKQNTTLCTVPDWADSMEHLHDLCDGRCDGVLLLVPPVDCPLIEALRQRKLPMVVVSGMDLTGLAAEVDIDHVGAARVLTESLLEMGHRRIAFVRSEYHLPFAFLQKRMTGWRSAMCEALGMDADDLVVTTEHEAPALLGGTEAPTAFLCSHDVLALKLMDNLAQQGVRVPKEVSVVGFDDIPDAAAAHPALTTVRQPVGRIGETAARLLMGLIDGEIEPGVTEMLPTEIIRRDSAMPPGSERRSYPTYRDGLILNS